MNGPGLQLKWKKCRNRNEKVSHWCDFDSLKLEFDDQGVYVIWCAGEDPRTVYVGSGDVADRIQRHRRDQDIQDEIGVDDAYVTWAKVDVDDMDGVERYLATQLEPRVGDRFPNAAPIRVNPPW